MARRKLTSVKNGDKVATVYREPETNEFVVRLKGRPQADYFTTDRDDAEGTAKKMVGLSGFGRQPRFSCKKSGAIIRQIVGRVHVGTSDAEVGAYAISRLKNGGRGMPASTLEAVRKCAVKYHHENRGLFRRVTR